MRTRRRRGEGYTEYMIIMMFVLICSVVGLLTAGSKALKKVKLDKGLCANCKNDDTVNTPIPPAGGGSDPSAPPPPPAPPSPPPPPAPAVMPEPVWSWRDYFDFGGWW